MNSEQPVNLLDPKIPDTSAQPRPKRWLYFFIALLAIILTIIIGKNLTAGWPTEADAYDAVTLKPKRVGFLQAIKNIILNSDKVLAGQADDRINILILGIGGPGHDGPYLSDTNIIASLKPSVKEAALISVPRDLAVDIPGHGVRKINSANAFGEAENAGQGGETARQIFSQTLNIAIPYYIRIDFKAFENIINAVGGIMVDVPRPFTDTQYPGENFSFQTIYFNAGEQKMDGARALIYARSRHGDNGEGSDFARSKRQEQILTALKKELTSPVTYLNPARIQEIYSALNSHVTTNMDFGQLMYLASAAKEVGEVKNVALDSGPNGYLINTMGEDGAFLLAPKSGNFNDITLAINNIFNAPAVVLNNQRPTAASLLGASSTFTLGVNLEIQNGTWRAGLAAKYAEKLKNNNFIIARVGNSLERPINKTVIYILNNKLTKSTLNTLSATLQAPYLTVLPNWLEDNYDNPATSENEQGMKYNKEADLLIILGADAKDQ